MYSNIFLVFDCLNNSDIIHRKEQRVIKSSIKFCYIYVLRGNCLLDYGFFALRIHIVFYTVALFQH